MDILKEDESAWNPLFTNYSAHISSWWSILCPVRLFNIQNTKMKKFMPDKYPVIRFLCNLINYIHHNNTLIHSDDFFFLFPRCTSNAFIYVPSHVPLHQTHSSWLQSFHINAFSLHTHTFCRHIHEYLWVAAEFCGKKDSIWSTSLLEKKSCALISEVQGNRGGKKVACTLTPSQKITFYQHRLICRSLSHQTAFKRINHSLYTSFNQLILQWAERWQAWFIKHGVLSK